MTAPTPSLREAAQMTLDALVELSTDGRLNSNAWGFSCTPEARAVLQAALALPEATPVAWQPLTPELLGEFESGGMGLHWLALDRVPTPLIGEYEWCQGRSSHGFNTDSNGRVLASMVTHVMLFVPPVLP